MPCGQILTYIFAAAIGLCPSAFGVHIISPMCAASKVLPVSENHENCLAFVRRHYACCQPGLPSHKYIIPNFFSHSKYLRASMYQLASAKTNVLKPMNEGNLPASISTPMKFTTYFCLMAKNVALIRLHYHAAV